MMRSQHSNPARLLTSFHDHSLHTQAGGIAACLLKTQDTTRHLIWLHAAFGEEQLVHLWMAPPFHCTRDQAFQEGITSSVHGEDTLGERTGITKEINNQK